MAVSLRRSKLAIVGAGSVGATLAYAALIRGIAHDVVLYDVSRDKVTAEVLDLRHGLQFCPPADVDGSDDIAVCDRRGRHRDHRRREAEAGPDPPRARRRERRDLPTADSRSCSQSPRTACLLMVTNPVDVLTLAALTFSGLDKSRVLGSGTVLDSARLRQLIAGSVGVASQSVHAWIAGEHGDTEFPVWSSASIGTVPVDRLRRPGRSPAGRRRPGTDRPRRGHRRRADHPRQGRDQLRRRAGRRPA